MLKDGRGSQRGEVGDVYARFGQELYARETILAAAIIAGEAEDVDGRALTVRIADALPHPSPTTRMRVATKLLQRMMAGAAVASPSSLSKANGAAPSLAADSLSELASLPANGNGTSRSAHAAQHNGVAVFARLLANLPDTGARRDLVYYAVARADGLVGAIARDILYPYFIEERIPAPYTEDEFIMANACLLLAPEPILTMGFVADYARRAWGFDSERTVGLALRILRQAGILLSSPLLGERGRIHAYTLAPHGLSLAALLWSLYDEFGHDHAAPAWDQVGRAQFARQFVVPASVVISRLFEAERAGLVGFWSAGGTRRVALKVRECDALARLLLTNPEGK